MLRVGEPIPVAAIAKTSHPISFSPIQSFHRLSENNSRCAASWLRVKARWNHDPIATKTKA